jgi:class 3 adenylate cyclase/tetratricopeptide (TPR) repeat protein
VTRAEERKVVSVLFCDLVGFTAASADADPEDVRRWLAPYHDTLRSTVERFGGTVEKFAGDAILAVFGAPRSHEDDAERAVRAGLAILDALAPGELRVRIGIDTGEALVDLGARPELGEPFVTGRVVNAAARLQTSAPVGAVVVGEATYRATSRVFGYEPLEAAEAKGFTTALNRWQAGPPRARVGADVMRDLRTPLVGRARDLLLLRTAFEKAVEERVPQFVLLVGEPGIGKSRLVAELASELDERPELVTWREGRCLPYGEGPFGPLAEIVKSHAGILETDRTDVVASKLDAVLPGGNEAAWIRGRVQPLLGVGAPGGAGTLPDSGELFEAWRRLIESFAETGPVVLVLEDLHWADDALLTFVDHLADWTSDLPLVVIGTARPELLERRPQWSRCLTISLTRLTEDETGELLTMLLEGRELEPRTRTRMLRRSGGNPLYAEELARMLRDAGTGADTGNHGADLPEGIAALIAARLDTLPPDSKALLADGAVVGRVFWAETIATMAGRDAGEVSAVLQELARKELVRPVRQSSMAGQHEYTFWHVLVRDVAYGQLPRSARAERHVAAADWIEVQCARRLSDAAGVLAYHLGTAHDLAGATGDTALARTLAPRARQFAWLAAERAMNLDAAQALTLLDRALQLTPADDPERPHVLSSWGWASFLTGRPDRALTAYREAVAGFEASGEVRGLARTLRMSTFAMSDMAESLATIERAVALLEPLGPSQDLVDILGGEAGILTVASRSADAIAVADRSLRMAAENGYGIPHRALEARGLSRVSSGDSGGLVDIKEALAALIASGRGRDAAVTWLNYGIALWQIEGPVAALATLAEAREFATRRRLAELQQLLRCTVLQPTIESGGLADVVADCRAQLAEEGPAFTTLRRIEVEAALARALLELDGDDGPACAEIGYDLAVQAGWPDFIVIASAPVALSRAAGGERDGVREVLARLVDLAELGASQEFAARLPALVRAGVAVGESELAATLTERVPPLLPSREYATATARALLAEHRGDKEAAAKGFAAAAAGWFAFGNRLEHGYALLGLSRTTTDTAQARSARTEARDLFTAMNATGHSRL